MIRDPDALADEVLAGSRRALGQAITLVESTRADDRDAGDRLLTKLSPHSGGSIRLGISGVPGVGKSTFIERFGLHLIGAGHRVAVLAVDPSSALSGGSILGDKTRMGELSRSLDAFIRPSPAGRTLGGVTRHTRETMVLVEAAGFDVVIVETVGVGQSETAVAEMTDMFLLLLQPGGGDELQGIKRGIVELADLVVVNKADGDMAAAAQRSAADYAAALRFLRARSAQWQVPVQTCSALTGEGIEAVWETVTRYRDTMTEADQLSSRRASQARAWLWSETAENLLARLRDDPSLAERLHELEGAVASGDLAPRVAARELVATLWKEAKDS